MEIGGREAWRERTIENTSNLTAAFAPPYCDVSRALVT